MDIQTPGSGDQSAQQPEKTAWGGFNCFLCYSYSLFHYLSLHRVNISICVSSTVLRLWMYIRNQSLVRYLNDYKCVFLSFAMKTIICSSLSSQQYGILLINVQRFMRRCEAIGTKQKHSAQKTVPGATKYKQKACTTETHNAFKFFWLFLPLKLRGEIMPARN